jgi:hypothetical protein
MINVHNVLLFCALLCMLMATFYRPNPANPNSIAARINWMCFSFSFVIASLLFIVTVSTVGSTAQLSAFGHGFLS